MDEEMDIHTWFGLSYCAYLVMPRSVLQAMPLSWQKRFVRMVNEINETLEYEGADYAYMVKRRVDSGQFTRDGLANYRYPPPITRKDGRPVGVYGFDPEAASSA